MKKVLVLCLLGLLAACSKVPAGHVGVKAYLLGGEKGVDAEVVGPGRYWIGWNEELYRFPTFTQTTSWTGPDAEQGKPDDRLTFQDVDGLKISVGVGLTYAVDKHKVADLFQKYRRGIDEITDVYLRNMIRDALVIEASTMKVDDIYGRGKEALIARVQERVRKQVAPVGLKIERIYWAGDMELPVSVQAALDAKIAATQQAQQRENEVATAKAQAMKDIEQARGHAESVMIKAKAEAERNRIIAASLSRELIDYQATQRWNGQLPQVASSAVPFINVPTK